MTYFRYQKTLFYLRILYLHASYGGAHVTLSGNYIYSPFLGLGNFMISEFTEMVLFSVLFFLHIFVPFLLITGLIHSSFTFAY